jgi:hypothetical protein
MPKKITRIIMTSEITKKLSMKKTFFATQLDSLFNSISSEYQNLINKKDIEISLLQEKIDKQENDIKNLVEIKNKFMKNSDIENRRLESLQVEVNKLRNLSNNEYNQNLANENRELKRKLQSNDDSNEIKELKEKIIKLQGYITKGANAYSSNLSDQKSEKLIQEISQSLKK